MEESFLVKHHHGHDELVVFELNRKISCVSNKFHELAFTLFFS